MSDTPDIVERTPCPFCGDELLRLRGEVERLTHIEQQSGNLLAIIHRDGGQYTEKNGYEKSVEDAHLVWAEIKTHADAMQAQLEKVLDSLVQREAREGMNNG